MEHVEALKKKFEAFQKELPLSESKLMSITKMAEEMVQEGHTDAEEIQGEIEVKDKINITSSGVLYDIRS